MTCKSVQKQGREKHLKTLLQNMEEKVKGRVYIHYISQFHNILPGPSKFFANYKH